MLAEYIGTTTKEEYDSFLGCLVSRLGSSLSTIVGDTEFCKELKGIAQLTEQVGLPFMKLLILNCGYDLLARCQLLLTRWLIHLGVHDAQVHKCSCALE